MHGEGVMTWQNPQVKYVGSWLNGKRFGQGKITFADDDEAERVYYEGNVPRAAIREGTLLNLRSIFPGSWLNDRKEGVGEMVWKSGSMYKGEWKAGLRDGFGIHTFHNKDKYVSACARIADFANGTFRQPDTLDFGRRTSGQGRENSISPTVTGSKVNGSMTRSMEKASMRTRMAVSAMRSGSTALASKTPRSSAFTFV